MAASVPPLCDFGWKAPDFALEGIDGKTYSLATVAGSKGLLVMFICNHCPFVRSVIDRIESDVAALRLEGIGAIAIMSNDTDSYPADSFENMQRFAAEQGLTFPYVIDRDQSVAKAYGAVCTPDFFGFNRDLELQYRGRLDESRMTAVPDARRELLEAMRQVAQSGRGPEMQQASMGCSIKWKAA
ncbi:MAG: thioredoxin family protein [Rhodospirillales bacterium]